MLFSVKKTHLISLHWVLLHLLLLSFLNYSLIFPIASVVSQSSSSISTTSDSNFENVSFPFVSTSTSPSVGDPSQNYSWQPSPFFSSDTSCLLVSFYAESPLSLSSPSSPSPTFDDIHPMLLTRVVEDLYRNTAPVHSSLPSFASTSFVAATQKDHNPRVSPLPPEP